MDKYKVLGGYLSYLDWQWWDSRMGTTAYGEEWEAVVGELRYRRSVESIDGGDLLVEVTVENTSEVRSRTRIVEDLPESVQEATLVTAAGGDPTACRTIDDWLLHEVTVPPSATRTTAYVFHVAEETTPSLSAPRIQSVEPVETDSRGADTPGNTGPVEEPSVDTAGTSVGTASENSEDDGPETVSNGSGDWEDEIVAEAGSSAGEAEARATDERETPSTAPASDGSVLEQLLTELDAGVDDAKREKLRASLGVTPSERARFEHLQARLEELAAYTDALETLIDDHGLDVVGEMRSAIEDNANEVATAREDIEGLEELVEQHRSRTVDELDSLRADVAERGAELDERLSDVESSLERIRADTTKLAERQREDRQVHATDARELHRSLSEATASIDDLRAAVGELETFHEQFRTAFTSTATTDEDRADAHGRERTRRS